MPKKCVYREIDHLPPALRAFTQAVRDLCADLSIREVTKGCKHSSKSRIRPTLDGTWVRPLDADLLREIFALSTSDARASLDLSGFLELHDCALDDARSWNSRRSQTQPPKSEVATPPATESEAIKGPAIEPTTEPLLQNAASPVGRPQGDRQGDWVGTPALLAHVAAHQVADTAGMLLYAGQYGDLEEAVAAIVACHRPGLADELEALLVYTAQRPAIEIMTVAKRLLENECPDAATRLLSQKVEDW